MPLRVAAYCRVSTDREDQANSLQSQQDYFRRYIQDHTDWILAGIYADEGVTGTSTRRREAFNRMVAAAQDGALDLILTKEVSRFARNTVDTLEYTRRLKALGVGVIFISDSIDTRDSDGELRLTLMASIAQEESRKTSQRVKWGQKRRMEAGVVFGSNSTYGFETRQGRLFVKPAQAEVVRRIYHKFLNEGKGTHIIARELYEEGVAPPKTAAGTWSSVMIRRILRNEKYVGDLLQKKYVTLDYLTHRKVENRGREEQIYLRDHHEAIIDRDSWEAVQEELARRRAVQGDGSKYSNRYWCSGKLRCGGCGSRFVLRKTTRPSGEVYKLWGCHSRVRCGRWKPDGQGAGAGCSMRMINDKSLTACVRFVLGQLELNAGAIVSDLAEDLQSLQGLAPDGAAESLRLRRAAVEEKRTRALDAFCAGQITDGELAVLRSRYSQALEALDVQLRQAEESARTLQAQQAGLDGVLQALRTDLDRCEEVYREVIERVTVFEDCIDLKVRFVPEVFRLWYTAGGRRGGYTTAIDRWELVADTQPDPTAAEGFET